MIPAQRSHLIPPSKTSTRFIFNSFRSCKRKAVFTNVTGKIDPVLRRKDMIELYIYIVEIHIYISDLSVIIIKISFVYQQIQVGTAGRKQEGGFVLYDRSFCHEFSGNQPHRRISVIVLH